jgi:hypothetical protein
MGTDVYWQSKITIDLIIDGADLLGEGNDSAS